MNSTSRPTLPPPRDMRSWIDELEAADEDVDIFNPSELLWALATRVNPAEEVVIIPSTHNHAMDASLPDLGAPGTGLWQRFGSKLLN